MNEASPVIIIRRSKRRGHEGKNSGAWKVAFADFTLAMMAFFYGVVDFRGFYGEGAG